MRDRTLQLSTEGIALHRTTADGAPQLAHRGKGHHRLVARVAAPTAAGLSAAGLHVHHVAPAAGAEGLKQGQGRAVAEQAEWSGDVSPAARKNAPGRQLQQRTGREHATGAVQGVPEEPGEVRSLLPVVPALLPYSITHI